MLKRIAIIGPESTGKSTLAMDLAKAYDTVFVPEYARTYIDQLQRAYRYEDLLAIAQEQIALEDKLARQANGILILDSTLTIIKVWSMHKYDRCDPWILAKEAECTYDLTLVCDIDIPWEDDPQREHPHLRAHFFDIYLTHAKQHPPYGIIHGHRQARLDKAIALINQLPGLL